jgi:hypothetical protein
VRTGLAHPATALAGISRAVAGIVLLALGAVLVFPVATGSRTYLILETWTVLTGLLVEQLIGPDLRAQRRP